MVPPYYSTSRLFWHFDLFYVTLISLFILEVQILTIMKQPSPIRAAIMQSAAQTPIFPGVALKTTPVAIRPHNYAAPNSLMQSSVQRNTTSLMSAMTLQHNNQSVMSQLNTPFNSQSIMSTSETPSKFLSDKGIPRHALSPIFDRGVKGNTSNMPNNLGMTNATGKIFTKASPRDTKSLIAANRDGNKPPSKAPGSV